MAGFVLTIIIGAISLGALFVGIKLKRSHKKAMPIRGSSASNVASGILVGGLVGLVLSLFGLASSVVSVVPANSVGVPVTFGKVNTQLTPGLHVVAPWTEVTSFSTRTQELSMLAAADEGDLSKDDSTEVISKGGGSMKVDLTVRFAVAPAGVLTLFSEAGSLEVAKDRFVRPEAREVARNVFGGFTAEEGYSTRRAEIGQQITDELKARLLPHGIVVESVNIRDVAPEKQVLDSINAILQSRNNALKAIEDQKEAVTQAETLAQVAERNKTATITNAEAQAQSVLIAAEAQAEANAKVAASLTPELVAKIIAEACADAIAQTKAQVINTCGAAATGTAAVAPTTVIVDGRTGG
jgi:regulator of protease activity HflC (stomatin/prohibitin superfamily)